MENKNENSRKPADKKPSEKKTTPVGTNVIGYLLALGIGALLIVIFLQGASETDLPYLQLLQLIKKGNPYRAELAVQSAAGAASKASEAVKKPLDNPHIEIEEN